MWESVDVHPLERLEHVDDLSTMPNPSGIEGTHLRRFTKDQSQFLSAYGVFHGDERHPSGKPLPTGSLRKSGGLTSGATSTHFLTQPGPPQSAYIIQPTMSLRSLQLQQQPPTGKTLPSNRTVGLKSTTYNYGSGVTYKSTSGEASRIVWIISPCSYQGILG